MQKILITGATGNIAGVTLQNLDPSEVETRALVRDEGKAAGIKGTQVDVVAGDLSRPRTLDAAFEGVDKVLLITPVSLDAVEMGGNAIAAARRNGNAHIVYLSSNVPEPAHETEVGRQRTLLEAELQGSGLPYTIIRPTFFMQNTLMAGQSVASDGMIFLPMAEGQLGMIDVRDVGATVAKVLTSDGHEGKTYVLTGPESISLHHIASTLTSVLGKRVTYADVPFEAAKQAMMGMGMADWMADMYNELFRNFSRNGANFVTEDVETITGRPATPYQQFAQDFADAFGGVQSSSAPVLRALA